MKSNIGKVSKFLVSFLFVSLTNSACQDDEVKKQDILGTLAEPSQDSINQEANGNQNCVAVDNLPDQSILEGEENEEVNDVTGEDEGDDLPGKRVGQKKKDSEGKNPKANQKLKDSQSFQSCPEDNLQPSPSNPDQQTSDQEPSTIELPTFSANIKPILDRSCNSCHGGNNAADGLAFDTYEIAALNIALGISSIENGRMPIGNAPKVTPSELELLKAWQEQGLLP